VDAKFPRRVRCSRDYSPLVALAAHYGYDDLVAGHITGKNGTSVGNATVLLYLVISLTVQQFVLLRRVARQDAAGEVPTEDPQVRVNN